MERSDRKTQFPAADRELAVRFGSLMDRFPDIRRRPMFGHPCAFANDQMFTGLLGSAWFVRLPDDARAELLAVDGAGPFEPMPGRPMKGYVVFPPSMVADAGSLEPWLLRSLAYVRSLPPRPPKR
jgi:TfoX N-terminal domain